MFRIFLFMIFICCYNFCLLRIHSAFHIELIINYLQLVWNVSFEEILVLLTTNFYLIKSKPKTPNAFHNSEYDYAIFKNKSVWDVAATNTGMQMSWLCPVIHCRFVKSVIIWSIDRFELISCAVCTHMILILSGSGSVNGRGTAKVTKWERHINICVLIERIEMSLHIRNDNACVCMTMAAFCRATHKCFTLFIHSENLNVRHTVSVQ